ncbi:unnamed protein product, partial [Phaeothamnion confervicola]
VTALDGRRKRRTGLMVGLNVLAVVAVAAMLVGGAVALKNYKASKSAVSELPVKPLPGTSTGLFATLDADGVLTSTTVFVLSPYNNPGGSIISVPVNSDSTSGSGDVRITLQQAFIDGGPDGLALAVESTLSVTLDFWSVATPEEAAALFLPLAPIGVDLPDDVLSDASGVVETIFPAGQRSLSADEAVQVLTSRDSSEQERVRRPNLEAFWASVAAAIGTGKGQPAVPVNTSAPLTTLPITSFETLVPQLFAGAVGSRGLPADPASDDINPDGLDVEELDRAEAVLVFASISPASVSAPLPGLVFRLEAPTGYEAQVKETIKAIMFLGGNVLSVSLNGASQPGTDIYVYD